MKTYIVLLHMSLLNILITIIRFARYHLPLASNSIFMTDSMYLVANLICGNLDRHLTNRRKLFVIPVAEYASCSHQVRTLKTNLLGLISRFSKYYFKTGTICLLFLPSHVLTALEYDGNHFGILLWKIVKPRDHNEIKPPIGKIFRKYKTIRHYLVMPQKQLLCLFVNKVYNNYNNLHYLQRNKKYYNLEIIFRKKANFSQ